MTGRAGKSGGKPLLRGLERRSSRGRRKQARRKSDGQEHGPQTPGLLSGDLHIMTEVLREAPFSAVIADLDERLVFGNRRADETLSAVGNLLDDHSQASRSNELIAGSILRYHNDASAVRRAIGELGRDEYHSGVVTPASFSFSYEIRALCDSHDRRIGWALYWIDISGQMQAERQVENLIRLRFYR